MQAFVRWYNTEHRHSAIRFVTLEARHRGDDRDLLASRHAVYQAARDRHPTRGPARPETGNRSARSRSIRSGPMGGPKKAPHEEYSCGNYLDEYSTLALIKGAPI